jgi:hypothetical protein
MISNTKLSRNCLKMLLLVVLFSACNQVEKITPVKEKKEVELTVGKYYESSFDWGSKDPFEEIEIDTIKIIGIKKGYVQWEYKNGQRQSCEIRIFRMLLRNNQ